MHHFQSMFIDLRMHCPLGIFSPGSSKGCKTLHTWPNSSGISSGNVSIADVLLSLELASSLLNSLIWPSVSCCIQVLGLHVAIAVGWDGDPSGKLILGLLVPLGSTSRVTGGVVVAVVIGTSGTLVTSLSWTSVDAIWFPAVILAFLLSTAAKNCQVDAITSSLLASFVLCIILGASLIELSGTVFTRVSGISIYVVSEVPNSSFLWYLTFPFSLYGCWI